MKKKLRPTGNEALQTNEELRIIKLTYQLREHSLAPFVTVQTQLEDRLIVASQKFAEQGIYHFYYYYYYYLVFRINDTDHFHEFVYKTNGRGFTIVEKRLNDSQCVEATFAVSLTCQLTYS